MSRIKTLKFFNKKNNPIIGGITDPANAKKFKNRVLGFMLFLSLSFFTVYAAEVTSRRSFALEMRISRFFICAVATAALISFFAALAGRLWAGFAFVYYTVFILSAVSYLKYIHRDEPLYFSDLSLSGQMGGFLSLNMVTVTLPMVFFAFAGAFVTRLVKKRVKNTPALKTRILAGVLSVICFAFMFFSGFFVTKSEPRASTGFFLGFISAPAHSRINRAQFSNAGSGIEAIAQKAALPHIIIILSESFWDAYSMPNLSLSADPIPFFRELSQTTLSGNMLSSTFGGGTDFVEFAVLTGISRQYSGVAASPYSELNSDILSLASFFKSNGYNTYAVHNYHRDFYSRDTAYPRLGFDVYTGLEDMGEVAYNGPYVDDKELTSRVIEYYEQSAAQQKRAFIFGVTMQNHQPYLNKYDSSPITVLDDTMHPSLKNAVESYLRGLNDADKQLKALVEYFSLADESVALLFFGDHQPTLGARFELYRHTGNMENPDKRTIPELKSILTTPFLIWSNYKQEQGYIENIDAAFLGNLLLNYVGADKPEFFNFLDTLYLNARFISRMDLFYIDGADTARRYDDMEQNLKQLLEEYASMLP